MTVPTKKRSVKVAGRHHDPAPEPETPVVKPKRRSWLVFAIVAVVLAGLAGWFTLEARSTNAVVAHNTALSDVAGTADAGKQLSAALGTLFSYRYDDPAKNERAAKELLAGPALAQYDQLFGQVRGLAADQKLVVTSTAVASGVKLLDGDRAALLVFLDQTGTRGDGQHSTGAAQLSVTAERVAGKWRVTGMSAA
jgi:Mce-associated membrane protein